MLDKLKISRGFTEARTDDGTPLATSKLYDSDRPVVILWAEDWERIKAVVEAAIEHADDVVNDGSRLPSSDGVILAIHDLRAHIEKGGA